MRDGVNAKTVPHRPGQFLLPPFVVVPYSTPPGPTVRPAYGYAPSSGPPRKLYKTFSVVDVAICVTANTVPNPYWPPTRVVPASVNLPILIKPAYGFAPSGP